MRVEITTKVSLGSHFFINDELRMTNDELIGRIVFSLTSNFLLKGAVFCLFRLIVCSSLLIYHLVLLFQLTPLGRFLCDATKEPKRSKGEPFANP